MTNFFKELKRRKVYKTSAAYAAVAFIIMQVVEIVFPMFEIPLWAGRFVIISLIICFPIAFLQISKELLFLFKALKSYNLYDNIWQAYAALLPVKTVGVMGDNRTYEYLCLLRAITSEDGMTADFFSFSKEFMQLVSNKIINNIKGINRVVYDITSKPPSTIELE